MTSFAEIQSQLPKALDANRPGSSDPHVVVALPSLSVAESLLAQYVDRLPALEHRYLLAGLMLPRIKTCEFVFITCEFVFISSQAPSSEVLDYYLSLVPADRRDGTRARMRILEVPDRTARAVAAKLLDRPDLVADLRASFRGPYGVHRAVERHAARGRAGGSRSSPADRRQPES